MRPVNSFRPTKNTWSESQSNLKKTLFYFVKVAFMYHVGVQEIKKTSCFVTFPEKEEKLSIANICQRKEAF